MNRLLLLMGIVIACVLATSVFAADAATTVPVSGPPSAQAMLANIAEELPSIMRLVTAIAYVLGIYFIFYAVLKLKQYGEMRSQMSHERHLQGSIVLFVAGALLLYLPTSVEIGLSTFWTNPSPYGYMTQTNPWGDFIKDVFLVMQIFGTIMFIKGLVMISHMSGQGHQPGMFGKALTHIIGGLLCINIYQFVQVVTTTLGIQIGS